MADALEGFGASTQALSVMEAEQVQHAFQVLGAKAVELAKTTAVRNAAVSLLFVEAHESPL